LAATASRVAQTAGPPGPTAIGQLKAPVDLQVLGGRLYAFAADRAIVSLDGTVWQPLPVGVVPDPSNPARFLKGGPSVQLSLDGGQNWKAPSAAPVGGPFQPVAISAANACLRILLNLSCEEPGFWLGRYHPLSSHARHGPRRTFGRAHDPHHAEYAPESGAVTDNAG